MSLTYGELFAGYGGLGMGVQSVLGGDLAWYADACKFDKDGNASHHEPHRSPCAIMAHHHPDKPNLGDVTKVDWTAVPKVDVITGGSPCQDLSHAGKRAGMKAGTRSGLWASMCDAIDIIRPRLVVWENVRGALSASADSAVEPCPICVGDGGRVSLRALGRVLGDLAELGYDAWWYGLRAADVGAAHGRWRVFVFATPSDADHAGWGEHGRSVTVRAEQPAAERAGDSAACGQCGHSWTDHRGKHGDYFCRFYVGTYERCHCDARQDDSLTLLPTPAVNDMGAAYTPETWDAWTARMQAAHGNGNGHGKSLSIEAQRLLPTPTTTEGTGAGSHGTGGDNLRTVVDQLLPTPRATDGTKGGPNQRGSSGDLMLPNAVQLLPTVTSQAAKHYGNDTDRGAGSPDDANLLIIAQRMWGQDADSTEAITAEELRDLRDANGAEAVREAPRGSGRVPSASSLLPVVCEHAHGGDEGRSPLARAEAQGGSVRGVCHDCGPACASQGSEPGEQRSSEPDDALLKLPSAPALAGGPGCAHGCGQACSGHSLVEWGAYEAAIRRWEVRFGRPAPDPTQPGAKGQPRLSAVFCEWLMGLPAGHVTNPAIGISRNDQLKALGNGVVPQQAAAATRAFLHDISKENAA